MTRQQIAVELTRAALRHQNKPTYWNVILWNYWLNRYLKVVKD